MYCFVSEPLEYQKVEKDHKILNIYKVYIYIWIIINSTHFS